MSTVRGDYPRSSDKMKFLDNLFDSSSELNENDTTFERSYIKLSDSIDSTRFVSGYESKVGDHISNENDKNGNGKFEERSGFFGLKTFMGLFFSFVVLSYVFCFNLLIVIPLLIIVLAMHYGTKVCGDMIKRISVNFKTIIGKLRVNSDVKYTDPEYRLM